MEGISFLQGPFYPFCLLLFFQVHHKSNRVQVAPTLTKVIKTFIDDDDAEASSSSSSSVKKALTISGAEGSSKSPKKVATTGRVQIRRKILPKADVVDTEADADTDDDDASFLPPPPKRFRKPTSKFDDFVIDESAKKKISDYKTPSSGDEVR